MPYQWLGLKQQFHLDQTLEDRAYYHCIALEDLFSAISAMSETVGQAAPLLFV